MEHIVYRNNVARQNLQMLGRSASRPARSIAAAPERARQLLRYSAGSMVLGSRKIHCFGLPLALIW
jgi:hypothetical protein